MISTLQSESDLSDNARNVPLCVDLDGTLVRTDLLIESILALVRKNALYVFVMPFWLFCGKARLKSEIAKRVDIDPQLLPYHRPFLDYLEIQRQKGRPLILASASNCKYVRAVAAHLGLFDIVLASTNHVNLSGKRKLTAIHAALHGRPFDYAANARADLIIWEKARQTIVVNATRGVEKAVDSRTKIAKVFAAKDVSIGQYLKLLRPHQWLKNILIFVPLIAAHKIQQPELVMAALFAFIAFSFCASSVYVINDLLDLPYDRQHPIKRTRPLGCGEVQLGHGLMMAPVLLSIAALIALWLPNWFSAVLTVYFMTSLAYSIRLKRVMMLDVVTLAGLYTLRVIGGAAAISVIPSFWLLAFCMFLFLSLALVKRFCELRALQRQGHHESAGRGYVASESQILAHIGTSSGLVSVLVLALYVNSDQVLLLYEHPMAIWLLCPLLLYWIGRVWMLANRDEIDEDPVVFAAKDIRTHIMGATMILIMWIAT